MEKVRFRDLSGWLQVAIIGGWAVLAIYAISFLVGFVMAIMEGGL